MNKIRIFGLGNPDQINKEYQIKHNTFGNNIGNSLFGMAAYRSVDWTKCESVKSVENADLYCITLANALSKFFMPFLTDVTKRIKTYNKKTIIIGVGIHSSKELSDQSLQDTVRDFANAVIATGGSIGVRGDITYKFLNDILGSSNNIFNIGCPSIRYFGTGIPQVKPKIKFDNNSKIAVCFTPYADSDEYTSFCDKVWRDYSKSFAIMQDQCEALLLFDNQPIPNNRIREKLPCYQQHFMIQQGRCRIEPNTRSWMNMLSSFDFCLGSRIHGCIAAILAGVPSLLIAIDERQIEIAKYNKMPYVKQNMINRTVSLSALYDFACENMDEVYKNYLPNLKIYADFLTANGIPLSFAI